MRCESTSSVKTNVTVNSDWVHLNEELDQLKGHNADIVLASEPSDSSVVAHLIEGLDLQESGKLLSVSDDSVLYNAEVFENVHVEGTANDANSDSSHRSSTESDSSHIHDTNDSDSSQSDVTVRGAHHRI